MQAYVVEGNFQNMSPAQFGRHGPARVGRSRFAGLAGQDWLARIVWGVGPGDSLGWAGQEWERIGAPVFAKA